jgi:hypothetical protein
MCSLTNAGHIESSHLHVGNSEMLFRYVIDNNSFTITITQYSYTSYFAFVFVQ